MTAARPTGITILAVLAAIGGVLGLFGGFVLLFARHRGLRRIWARSSAWRRSPTPRCSSRSPIGAWTLQPWAWALGVAVAIFGIVVSILYIIGGQSIASQALGIVVDGAILYYLNQPGIKALFGRA